jgi:translation initiation factor 2B subunit (eIF-2B alpha/beta/delta family)
LVNLANIDELLTQLAYPEIAPCIVALTLMRRVIEEDLARQQFLHKIVSVQPMVADLQFLNVSMSEQQELMLQQVTRPNQQQQYQQQPAGSSIPAPSLKVDPIATGPGRVSENISSDPAFLLEIATSNAKIEQLRTRDIENETKLERERDLEWKRKEEDWDLQIKELSQTHLDDQDRLKTKVREGAGLVAASGSSIASVRGSFAFVNRKQSIIPTGVQSNLNNLIVQTKLSLVPIPPTAIKKGRGMVACCLIDY